MSKLSTEETRSLASAEKAVAARIINRVLLKIPDGYENDAAAKLVDAIVNAAILEMSAIQKEAMKP